MWHELNWGLDICLARAPASPVVTPAFSCLIHRMRRAISRRMVTSADGAGGRALSLPC